MEKKARYAVESITGDSSLTDDMDDALAARLIEWGGQHARRLAESFTGVEIEEELDTNLQNLRRVMRRINKLVGMRDRADSVELVKLLSKMFEAAAEVPALQALPPDDLEAMVMQIKNAPREEVLEMIMAWLLRESAE